MSDHDQHGVRGSMTLVSEVAGKIPRSGSFASSGCVSFHHEFSVSVLTRLSIAGEPAWLLSHSVCGQLPPVTFTVVLIISRYRTGRDETLTGGSRGGSRMTFFEVQIGLKRAKFSMS